LTDFQTTINEIKNHSLGIAAITLTIKYVIPQINSQQKEIKVNLFVI
jgi:hypothetical protein